MIRLFSLVLLLPLFLISCNSDERCGPNSGCPPGNYLNQAYIKFQLISAENEVMNLTENNIEEISWTSIEVQEEKPLAFDTIQNIGILFLLEDAGSFALIRKYRVATGFGIPQTIQINLESKPLFEDECNPCIQYFISSIIQNERDSLFSGELTEEDIVKIKTE
mgnify:CR=1 FL=1